MKKSSIFSIWSSLGPKIRGFFAPPPKPSGLPVPSQKGSVLVILAIFMLLTTVFATVGAKLVQNARRESKQYELQMAEAENAARAGLEDALGWFRRQATQPLAGVSLYGSPNPIPTWSVTLVGTTAPITYIDQPFNPRYSTDISTDTLNEGIGLVKEFSPQGSGSVAQGVSTDTLWARYEVKRQPNPYHLENTPTPSGTSPTPTPPPWNSATPTATPDLHAAHDITGRRVDQSNDGRGLVWSLVSTGYIYQRKDFTKDSYGTNWAIPFDQPPNKVLAKARMSTELRKVSFKTPFGVNAAIYTRRSGSVATSGSSRISNNGIVGSFSWAAVTTCSNPTGAGVISGASTCVISTASNTLSPGQVFGMSVTELQFYADYRGDSASGQVLDIQGDWKMAYFNGDLVIDPASAVTQYRDWNKYGVLVVNGNLTIRSTGAVNNSFKGLVYVTKNLTLDGASINGMVIMGHTGSAGVSAGNVTLTASAGAFADISYDPNIYTKAQSTVIQYRENTSAKHTLLTVPGL